MTTYKGFIQRVSELFRQEVECEDSEQTLNNIINILNKCGLKEVFHSIPVAPSAGSVENEKKKNNSRKIEPKVEDKQNTPNSNSSNGTNCKTGYNLFIKEASSSAKQEGTIVGFKELAAEWKILSQSEKNEYNRRAKSMLNQK